MPNNTIVTPSNYVFERSMPYNLSNNIREFNRTFQVGMTQCYTAQTFQYAAYNNCMTFVNYAKYADVTYLLYIGVILYIAKLYPSYIPPSCRRGSCHYCSSWCCGG